MEDFRLKVFHSVARNKSFTKAAAQLFITQPAVTKQIKDMEVILGVRLVERISNSVLMPGEGELVLRYANEIFHLYREFKVGVSLLRAMPAGAFTVGASAAVAQYLISPVLGG